jgi:hypothetical protein
MTTAADADPIVARARRFALEVLRPAALQTDRSGVKAATIDQLQALGLFNHRAPAEYGGGGLDALHERRIHEHLVGGCMNTWLVWAQHVAFPGKLAAAVHAGEPIGELGAAILRGELLVGAGVSDVRRFPDHYIDARRSSGGWTLSGTVSWVTGWGLSSVLVVSAVEAATRRVVTAIVRVGDRTWATPLELHSLGGSRTERVVLEDVEVADEDVLEVVSLDDWQERDQSNASNAGPHHFGLAMAVLDELLAERHPLAREAAERWGPRVEQLRADAYGLADEIPPDGPFTHVAERAAIKAEIGEVVGILTRALVVARAGRALAGDDTAQLHARNALFVLVQGQTPNVREAQLAGLADPELFARSRYAAHAPGQRNGSALAGLR